MYKHILKPILFRFNPETAHNILFSLLSFLRYIPFAQSVIRAIYQKDSPSLEKEVFGITFPNPVGLAGGLDKNGEYYNDMANFGFGFVEIGSLTPNLRMEIQSHAASVFLATKPSSTALESTTTA